MLPLGVWATRKGTQRTHRQASGGPYDDPAVNADAAVRWLIPGRDFVIQESRRNVTLTDVGIRRAEEILALGDLYSPSNLPVLASLQNALHAHALLEK